MPGISSVQRAHDELLAAMPQGASHDDCPLCEKKPGAIEKAKEVVQMPEEKVFSEAQHVALVTSAVERETSALTETNGSLTTEVAALKATNAELATSSTELSNQVDVLASEKAAETVRADAAEKALEDFTAELTELAAVEARKTERVDAIKAADETLSDEYFTDARVQRWAEMADAQFGDLLEDLTEAAAKKIPAPAAKGPSVDMDGDEDEVPTVKAAARETAAFKEGDTPTVVGVTSLSGSYLTAIGKLPVASSN